MIVKVTRVSPLMPLFTCVGLMVHVLNGDNWGIMPKSHYWETLLPPAPHQACKSRAVRWQRLDAGRWRDSEAERPRAGAAGEVKLVRNE